MTPEEYLLSVKGNLKEDTDRLLYYCEREDILSICHYLAMVNRDALLLVQSMYLNNTKKIRDNMRG